MRIDDLVTYAAAAALDLAETKARAESWKARAVGEAEWVRMNVPGAREFMSGEGRLGALRLDGADLPAAPLVTDGLAFAAYLAEAAPEHASATVTIPAASLALLEGALVAFGIDAKITLQAVGGEGYLKDQCKVVADVDTPGAWKVLAVAADGTTTAVPGVTAQRPQATWKLIPNNEKRRDRIAAAVAEVDEQAESMRDDPTPPVELVAVLDLFSRRE